MVDCDVVGCCWIELPKGKYRVREEKSMGDTDSQYPGKVGHIFTLFLLTSGLSCWQTSLLWKGSDFSPGFVPQVSLNQYEVDVSWRDLISHPAEGDWQRIAPLRVLSFDIECAGRKGAALYLSSCSHFTYTLFFLSHSLNSKQRFWLRCFCFPSRNLSRGRQRPCDSDSVHGAAAGRDRTIHSHSVHPSVVCQHRGLSDSVFHSGETDAAGTALTPVTHRHTETLNFSLIGVHLFLCEQSWAEFMRTVDPDIITGYNIQNFDFPYLINRAAALKVRSSLIYVLLVTFYRSENF